MLCGMFYVCYMRVKQDLLVHLYSPVRCEILFGDVLATTMSFTIHFLNGCTYVCV